MKQTVFYKYAALFLLVLNIVLVSVFFATKPPGPPHRPEGKRFKVEQILQLDADQQKAFTRFADEHKASIKNFDKNHKALISQYFLGLLDQENPVDNQEVLARLQQIEGNKIKTTYEHLVEVKKILRPDQLEHYEDFVDHILDRITGKKPPRPHRD